jgi:hypothetical protein
MAFQAERWTRLEYDQTAVYMDPNTLLGHDPYLPLHENLLLHLIVSQAAAEHDGASPALRLKMGDILESCGAHGEVALTHSNCLLAVADADGRSAVKDFYSQAAATPKEDIRNPLHYADELISHGPEESRVRGYGCGSPVLDADLQAGESVVDLGSGSGVECFIASRLVGRTSRSSSPRRLRRSEPRSRCQHVHEAHVLARAHPA